MQLQDWASMLVAIIQGFNGRRTYIHRKNNTTLIFETKQGTYGRESRNTGIFISNVLTTAVVEG